MVIKVEVLTGCFSTKFPNFPKFCLTQPLPPLGLVLRSAAPTFKAEVLIKRDRRLLGVDHASTFRTRWGLWSFQSQTVQENKFLVTETFSTVAALRRDVPCCRCCRLASLSSRPR